MEKIFFLSTIILYLLLFISPIISIESKWTEYSACKYGRLQSPIELNEYDSTYSNKFSFVYQYYKAPSTKNLNDTLSYTKVWSIGEGNFVNFEKEGVIKQYELTKIELYPGLHKIDGKAGDYEIHLVHKKNLDFNSNKNQYRKIVDANMYLVVVLRYKKECDDKNYICISDNGLLSALEDTTNTNINLNSYPIFQDKRAYLYEGSFLYTPCDENVNYYVVNDFFYLNQDPTTSTITGFDTKVEQKERYDRPILKNFMNYKEFLGGEFYSMNIFYLISIMMMILL